MRKIRVICNDPYATDCSSDDEESIEIRRTNGKLFVQEISVLIPSIHQLSLDATDSSSREDRSAKDGPICINQEIGSTVAENHRSLGKEKHLGIKKTSSDKWDVQIHHPTEGTTMCLGSHNTFEEAMNVYEEKKLEFVLLSKLIKQKKPVMQSAKRKRQKFVLDDLNISETASGKWAAWVMDPISNRKIWMGIYATPEEVVISYCRKKHDFDSSSNPKNLGKGSSSVQGNPHDSATNNTSSPAQDIASPMDTDIASLKRPGIKLTRTGRWGVTIYHPTLECRHWLGSYDTPEEAAKVFDKKKTEFEAGSGSHGAAAAAEVVNQESCSLGTRKLTDASTVVIDAQGHLQVAYKGIRLRESGRWAAEIKDPLKGKNTHIGTFDTPEEAADAYSKRKRELNEMMSLGKKQKCKGKAEADKVGVSLEADDVGAVIKTEPNNASPSFTLEAENSTVTAVSSQNSEGSNTKTNNDKQIPGSSLSAEDEFGFSVINSYGQLIGEYSRIDDELWLSGPGAGDHDECGGVHGTQNLVLDHKPSFSPTSLGI